jgi:predicted NAD/FAD-binding protein
VPKTEGRSIAVVGSGVAGLTAAFVLSGRDRVTLYEADSRLGGHAHTHEIDRGDGTVIGVDSAFLVHHDRTYPTLCRLFDELGVGTQESDMSTSVRAEASGLEYAAAPGARRLFASWHGLWLITIAGWSSLATVLSPALMTYFLVSVTGGRLTEEYMKGCPGFAEYQQRTSIFIPRPPRSARK